MFTIVRHAARSSALVACLLGILAGPVSASAAEVVVGRESLDGVGHDFMICGWGATFTTSGQAHWTVTIAGDRHGHVNFQESVSYVLVIDDDPNVPEALRGATWRGHNMISFATNFDLASEREVTRTVQTAFEGPFRSLSERITLVIDADGTARVDRLISNWDSDCEALAA
jgi:hypothetical protein